MEKGKTLISKSKKVVPKGKEETLMLLRAYQNHPCVWSEIVEELMDNIEKLPKEAQEIYRNGSIRKMRDRLGGKLRKLMAAKTAYNYGDICIEVERVKKLETRLQDKVEAAVRDTAPPQAEPSPKCKLQAPRTFLTTKNERG